MLPYVVVHNAVSIDGRMDFSYPHVGLYNFLALIWKPDIMLTSSNTIISWFEKNDEQRSNPEPEIIQSKQDSKIKMQKLIIVDSKGRVKCWDKLFQANHWQELIALCSESTPKSYLDYLDEIKIRYFIAGQERVDFHRAFNILTKELDTKVIRVDSGGTLNGVLFKAGLVNEVSILIYPYLIGGKSSSSIYHANNIFSNEEIINLKLIETRKIRGNVIWNRYEVNNNSG